MNTMRVAQIPAAKREFQIVERPIPEPPPGTVRVKVTACGVCHSDVLVKEGLWPGIQYPRVPGHEVTGTIDAVGAGTIGRSEEHTSELQSRLHLVCRLLLEKKKKKKK